MSYYRDAICPYCEKPILETEDRVVCPDCGTPYHRSCYVEHGTCFFEAEHASGYSWKSPVLEAEELNNKTTCPQCGRSIDSGSIFCNYCGATLSSSLGAKSSANQQAQGGFFLPAEQQQTTFNPKDEIDGIPVSDWAVYIGRSANYYLYNFKLQDKSKHKTAFTLSAVMFPFIYFLYRRVWGAALISAAMNLLLSIPSILSTLPVLFNIDLGINMLTLDQLANTFGIISIVVNLIWGLFAVWLFRKKAVRHMTRLKSESLSDSEYRSKLLRVSGPSKTAVIVAGAIYVALVFFTSFASSFYYYFIK